MVTRPSSAPGLEVITIAPTTSATMSTMSTQLMTMFAWGMRALTNAAAAARTMAYAAPKARSRDKPNDLQSPNGGGYGHACG